MEYMLIASRDAFECRDAERDYELATQLARSGASVTVFLIQNGVMAARRSALSATLTALGGTGVSLLADDFSLRERGIRKDQLAPSVQAAPIDVVIDKLALGARVLWC